MRINYASLQNKMAVANNLAQQIFSQSVPNIISVQNEGNHKLEGRVPLMGGKSSECREEEKMRSIPVNEITRNANQEGDRIGTCITLAALALVVSFAFFTGFKLNPEMAKYNENITGAPVHSRSLHRSFKKFSTAKRNYLNMTLQPTNLFVTSYIEYQSKMYAVSDNQPVSVHIKLQSLNEWPHRASLARAEQIISLQIEGAFTMEMFTFLVQYVANLENLTVISSGSNLCDDIEEMTSTNGDKINSLSLPRLKSIALTNFTMCANVLFFLANNVEMNNVRHFRLENGVTDSKNMRLIRKIICNIRNSLRKLSFPMTKWNVQLFGSDFPVLPNLNLLRMDFLTDTNLTQFIGVKLSRVLPNLTNFHAVSGFAPWNDFRCILNSTTLVKLSTGLEIPKNRTSFNLSFIEKAFPLLEDLHLYLNFDNQSLSSSESCRVNGLEVLHKPFLKLEIQANCNMQLGNKGNNQRKRMHQMWLL